MKADLDVDVVLDEANFVEGRLTRRHSSAAYRTERDGPGGVIPRSPSTFRARGPSVLGARVKVPSPRFPSVGRVSISVGPYHADQAPGPRVQETRTRSAHRPL